MPHKIDTDMAMLMGDEKDHYRVYHPHMGEIRIAKSALDDSGHGAIKKLATYADGGIIEPDTEPETDEGIVNRSIASNFEIKKDPIAAKLDEEKATKAAEEIETQKAIDAAAESDLAAKAEAKRQYDVANPPRAQQNISQSPVAPVTQPIITQANNVPPEATAAASTEENPYKNSYDLQKKAIMADTASKVELARQNAIAYENSQKEMAKIATKFEEEKNIIGAERTGIINSINSNKIDPNKFWHNMSTGNQIGATISIILGGIGQGLTKSSTNVALDSINKAIDLDLKAQQENQSNRLTLLSQNRNRSSDSAEAYARSRMQMLAATEAKVSQNTARAQGAAAKANGQSLLAALDQEQQKLQQNWAVKKTLMGGANASGGFNPEMIQDPELKKRVVAYPVKDANGRTKTAYGLVNNAEERKQVQDDLARVADVESTLTEVASTMSKGISLGNLADKALPYTRKEEQTAQDAHDILSLKLKDMFSKSDRPPSPDLLKKLEELAPSGRAVNQDVELAKLASLRKLIQDHRNTILSGRVSGFTPPTSLKKKE